MNNKFFPEIKERFGFGCMRLPMKDGEVDFLEFSKMIDEFIAEGFNYFDTAHGYIGGKSELAIKECLAKRYAREDYILTNKLSSDFFKKEEDIRPLFEKQLECCGVEYFDYYLMHAQGANNYEQYQNAHAYEVAQELKKEGKVRHVGLSFHDTPEFLDKILTDHPEVEVVQIQFNYLDYEEPMVQSRGCYEVCKKHNKPVIVMEPVKGGSLINLPEDAQKKFDELQGGSNASYALRFALNFDQMMMVLSGMSDMDQMRDNLSFTKDVKPLTDKELTVIGEVKDIFLKDGQIACTGCRYCTAGCPKKIQIPDLFTAANTKKRLQEWPAYGQYNAAIKEHGEPQDCIKCGKCEQICPQHLPIRDLLVQVAEDFKKRPF